MQISSFFHRLSHNLLIGFGVSLLFLPFHDTHFFHQVEDWAIDVVIKLHSGTPPAKLDTPSFVWLDIDEPTYRNWGEPLMTPRDKLLQLLKVAVREQAKIVVVDIDLSCPTELTCPLDRRLASLDKLGNQNDKELYNFLASYEATYCQKRKCPYLFLARNTRNPLDSNFPYREPVASFLEPVIKDSPQLHWASTLFDLADDQRLRRWHLWQPTCDGEVAGVLPSMQWLTQQIMENGNTGQDILKKYVPHCPSVQAQSGHVLPEEEGGWFDLVKQTMTSIKQAVTKCLGGHIDPLEDSELKRRILYRIPWSEIRLPTMADGHLLLDIIPAQHITDNGKNKPLAPDFLKGRIVVIGGSYESSRDIYATPIGRMPGALVLINAIHSRLQHGELHPPECWKMVLTEISLIVLMSLVFSYFSAFSGLLVSGFIIIFIFVPLLTFSLFDKYGVWLDFAIPLLAVQLHYLHLRCKEKSATPS